MTIAERIHNDGWLLGRERRKEGKEEGKEPPPIVVAEWGGS